MTLCKQLHTVVDIISIIGLVTRCIMETHIIRWSNSVTIMNVNMEYTEDKKAPAW